MKTITIRRLIRMADHARSRAYAPYSRFHVGAVIVTSRGSTFTGCNVENASYGLTLCAERAAICAAVTAGHHVFKAIAVVADGAEPAMPCGACLQCLAEFGKPDLRIILAGSRKMNAYTVMSLSDLLPRTFVLNPTRLRRR